MKITTTLPESERGEIPHWGPDGLHGFAALTPLEQCQVEVGDWIVCEAVEGGSGDVWRGRIVAVHIRSWEVEWTSGTTDRRFPSELDVIGVSATAPQQ